MSRFAVLLVLQLLLATVAAQDEGSAAVSEGMTHGDTGTTIYAGSTYFKCTTDLHITVTSTAEISSLLKEHYAKATPVKIRATRHGMHSAAGFVCPGKRASTKLEFDSQMQDRVKDPAPQEGLQAVSINVLMHRMNRVVEVNTKLHQLTVEAGMTNHGLVDAAEDHRLSVPPEALSIYGNLTVGGVVSASAHGSGSSMSELVRKLKWVNSRGEVITSHPDDPEFSALLGGLGLLGILTEITLQLEPWSLTVAEVRDDVDDKNIVSELERIMKEETPYVMTYWQPDLGIFRTISFKKWREGDKNAPPVDLNATMVMLAGLGEDVASAISGLHAAWGNDLTDDSDSADMWNSAACGASFGSMRMPVFHSSTGHPTKHLTLPTNRAGITPECSPHCFWESHYTGVSISAAEFAIKRSLLPSWIHDLKLIVQTELSEVEARLPGHGKSCLPGPFMLRFGKGSSTLISTNTGNDDIVYVQWLPLQSARTPRKPGKHSAVWETIEQLTLCKYHGRPSYGQNHERIFRHPRCHVRETFPEDSFEKMMALQQSHDPKRMFEPELYEMIVKKEGPEYAPLCALQLWCFCEEDAHCGDQQACVASPVFPEYKVCKVVVPTAARHEEL